VSSINLVSIAQLTFVLQSLEIPPICLTDFEPFIWHIVGDRHIGEIQVSSIFPFRECEDQAKTQLIFRPFASLLWNFSILRDSPLQQERLV
jgi:hypothetical protein